MMPTTTYIALANLTLTSSSSSVTFINISQSYKDLVLVIDNAKTTTGTRSVVARLNNDSGNTYSYVDAYGNGSSTGSISQTLSYAVLNGGTDFLVPDAAWNGISHFMDYSAIDKHKTIISRGNRSLAGGISGGGVSMIANRWANTSAITSIVVSTQFLVDYPFASGTTFALYGIAA